MKKVRMCNLPFEFSDVSFENVSSNGGKKSSVISPMVSFLTANRNKLIQICLDDDNTMDLCLFDGVFESIMDNRIECALHKDKRLTAIILDVLQNNIH